MVFQKDTHLAGGAPAEGDSGPPVDDGRLADRRRRTERLRKVVRVMKRWRRTHEWIGFAQIADWCACQSGSIVPDESCRRLAYQRLLASLEAGEFERDKRSRVRVLNPETCLVELTRERFAAIRENHVY